MLPPNSFSLLDARDPRRQKGVQDIPPVITRRPRLLLRAFGLRRRHGRNRR